MLFVCILNFALKWKILAYIEFECLMFPILIFFFLEQIGLIELCVCVFFITNYE